MAYLCPLVTFVEIDIDISLAGFHGQSGNAITDNFVRSNGFRVRDLRLSKKE